MFWNIAGDSNAHTYEPKSVPAPIGGLNARDSLAAMPETDAPTLINWWPQPFGCTVRKGYSEWATGMPAQVNTIAQWANLTGSNKYFAWSSAGMYDISTKAAVGAAIVAGLATSTWETCNLVNAAGSYLIVLAGNGTDNGIIYKLAGATRLTLGDGIVVDTWAGIDPKNARCPIVHQRRLWVLQKDSPAGWYLPPDAIQGTFVKFDFGSLFSRGGFAQAIGTWTLDDGNGAEDHLVVLSSRGEVVVFGGTNPSSDATWSLVGVYFVGAPVAGARVMVKAGGDIFILTQQGVVSMTATTASTKVNQAEQKVTSNKIQFLLSQLTTDYGTAAGWDIDYFPKLNMLMVNVPISAGVNQQLAANQILNSWTTFDALNSACWATLDSDPYFGSSTGKVYKFWDGFLDNVPLAGTGGTGIIATAVQAYSYLGKMATQKQVGMYRPTLFVGADTAVAAYISYNFESLVPTAPTALPLTGGSLWGSGLWDSAIWGGSSKSQRPWFSAEGVGFAAAISMVVVAQSNVLWVSTDYTISQGAGVL